MKKAFLAFIILLISICCSAYPNDISQNIIDNVKAFDSDAEYKSQCKLAWMNCLFFKSNDCVMYVDSVAEKPTLVLYTKTIDESREYKIYDEIKEAALDFLSEHAIDIKDCILSEKTYDRGSSNKEYLFSWHKQNETGVQLPYRINIVVNNYGDVTELSVIDRPVEISLEPKISDDECLSKIKTKISDEDMILKSKTTFVKIGMDGKQKLVKRFVFQKTINTNDLIQADIDAITREIIGILRHQ